jgi:hypothetical protein
MASAQEAAGRSLTSAAEVGAELLAGLESLTLEMLGGQVRMFFQFMEADGRDWVTAGLYDVMLYLGEIYRSGPIGGSSVAGYVSAINSLYSKIALPARGLISPRALHPVVKGALEGTSGGRLPRLPTMRVGCQLLWSGQRRVTLFTPVLCRPSVLFNLKVAPRLRGAGRPILSLDRQTSNLMLLRANLRIHERILHVTRPSLALGRKDKSAPTVILRRQGPDPLPPTPNCGSWPLPPSGTTSSLSLYLPTDVRRPGGKSFRDPATLLVTAVAAVGAASDPGPDSHAHRRGATTAAHKLGVTRPTLNKHADWAPTSTIFESNSLVPDLPRSPLAHQYFGGLLDPPAF